jgi:hypothetical protein
MANRAQSVLTIAILGVIVAVLIALYASERPNIRDEQCRLRLFRLAGAVNLWIEDHGHRMYPAIRNPAPGAEWTKDRVGSAGVTLWSYLGGDVPRERHADESEDDYRKRMRKGEMSLCPVNELEYWYNDARLAALDPNDLAAGKAADVWYFHCQHATDGKAPHHKDGKPGTFIAYSGGEARTVTRAQFEAMQAELSDLERTGSDSRDIRARVDELTGWLRRLEPRLPPGTDQTTVQRLTLEVRFEADR